jgi:hypothetical protein
MSSGLFKAVCYRCAYEGPGLANRCPACQFPMILEAEGTPPARRIDDILERVSMDAGAPPLPGVHAEKRKAQLLSEARQERRERDRRESALPPPIPRASRPLPAVPPASHLDLDLDLESVKIPRFRTSALLVALFCASAVAVGAVAAALQSGAL